MDELGDEEVAHPAWRATPVGSPGPRQDGALGAAQLHGRLLLLATVDNAGRRDAKEGGKHAHAKGDMEWRSSMASLSAEFRTSSGSLVHRAATMPVTFRESSALCVRRKLDNELDCWSLTATDALSSK